MNNLSTVFNQYIILAIGKILTFLNSYSQVIAIVIMAFTVWLMKKQIDVMKRQIDEMRKIEDEKRIIAISSLIEELKYNKEVIRWYIQHSEVGSNINPEAKGFSWEWNPPHFAAYNQFFNTVTTENVELGIKIMTLYGKLESCKTIVYYIHQLLASNIIEVKVITNGEQLLENIVKSFNKQLYDISKEVEGLFDELINGLGSFVKKTNNK
jgi:hypothetical protein